MTIVQILSIVIAILTLLTEIAAVIGLVWSIATAKPLILTVVLVMMVLGFGVFVYYDAKKYFGNKTPTK